MRRLLGILLLGALLLVGPGSQRGNVVTATDSLVVAQGTMSGGTWSSGIQIQNLSNQTANAVLEYYDQNGNMVYSVSLPPIAAGSSVNHTTSVDAPSLASGQYSVVVSSDQRVVAIVNQTNYGATSKTGSYNAVAATDTSTSVGLPLLFRASASGWNTMFAVQNAGDSDATVTATYSSGQSETWTVKSGASKIFDQANAEGQPGHPVGLPTGFFSAVVTGNQPLAVVVNEVNANTGVTLTYNGFPSTGGDTTVIVPLLFKQLQPTPDGLNPGGRWRTGVQVQNVGNGPTDITIAYAGIAQTSTRLNVPPGGFANFSQFAEAQIPDPWFGGATITSSGQPIVAIVNETHGSIAKGMAYNGFPVKNATNNISTPLLFKNAWATGIQVQNVGNVAADVNIMYSNDPSKRRTIPGVQPGQSTNIYQPSDGLLSAPWFGSAVVTSTQPIVAVVNETNTSRTGDASMSYNAFNY